MGEVENSQKLIPTYKTTALTHNPKNFSYYSYVPIILIIDLISIYVWNRLLCIWAKKPHKFQFQPSTGSPRGRNVAKINHTSTAVSSAYGFTHTHTCTTLRWDSHCAVPPSHTWRQRLNLDNNCSLVSSLLA